MGARVSKRKHTITHEQENFTRFGLAIVGVGTNVLREILETYIPSKDIASKVTSTSHPSLWRSGLNQRQIHLIGQAATDGYRDFDITLCYTLLRNLNVRVRAPFSAPFPNPTQGWGTKPNPTDTTQSDDIERIRILRNEMYGHLANPSIPMVQFTDRWNELRGVCTRMKNTYPSGTDFLQELISLESCKVSRVLLDKIVELVKQIGEYGIQIAEHGTQIDEHSTHLATLDTETQMHGTQIDEHSTQLATLDTETQMHGTRIDEHSTQLATLDTETQMHGTQIDEHRRKLDEHARLLGTLDAKCQADQHKPDEELDVKKLKQRLLKINKDITKVITLSPLQKRGKTMPVELLFSQVVIRNEPQFTKEGHAHMPDSRTVNTDIHTGVYGYRHRVKMGIDLKSTYHSDNDSVSTTDGDNEPVSSSPSEYNFKRYTHELHPDQILKIDDEFVKNIYMLGDAAHGKTTYCIWLLHKWCNAQNSDNLGRQLDEWETILNEFDFVFLLQFRYVNPSRASVVDMICQNVFQRDKGCHATVRKVLSSDKYRSLIIMDGLDEWNPNEETMKQLTCQAMPNIEDVAGTVSCFFSMRPWVFSALSEMVQIDDRVIEIHGLSRTGMKEVIKNVLKNHYNLKKDSMKYRDTYKVIKSNLVQKGIHSFMQIPLLAVICVQIWYEGKQVGNSMTSFYAAMLHMLIERANDKHKLESDHTKTVDIILPKILSAYECIENNKSVLFKLQNVAYEGLIHEKTNLVFMKRKLEKEIGLKGLKFALDVGLISQKETSSLFTKNVSVHFLHKSVQEFLAAIYIVTNTEVGDSFCEHLSNVNAIMNLSNVIMFTCGMCPSLGSAISEHVSYITDREHIRYTKSPYPLDRTIEELYKLEISWYRELRYAQTDRPMTSHVLDVYLNDNSDIETVRITKEVMCNQGVNLRSLTLFRVSTNGERGITDTELNDFLSNKHRNTKSLVKVSIAGGNNGDIRRFLTIICLPRLKTLYLEDVRRNDTNLGGNVCPPLVINIESLQTLILKRMTSCDEEIDLAHTKSLRVLKLYNVTLGERGLNLSAMTSLQDLDLTYMTLDGTELYLSTMKSLRSVTMHSVTLVDRGLDLSSVTTLEKLDLSDMTLVDRGLNLPTVKSLCLHGVSLGDRGLVPSDLTSLHELRLSHVTFGDRGLDVSGMTSLNFLGLYYFGLSVRYLDLSDMVSLGYLGMSDGTLDDRGIDLSAKMVDLKCINFSSVKMSTAGWQHFILSLLNIQHRFKVNLGDTNIDDESRTKIRSSPHFDVTNDGEYTLNFTRVWPLSHVTQ